MSQINPASKNVSQDATTQALALVQADMAALDALIAKRLDSGVPLVREISQYIISAGGKRLRPALLLLMCGALGVKDERRFALAAIVEFIHTATLLHDDVVDESTLRRGRATANEAFGNAASVLVGDFLYSRAFQMMAEVDDMRVMALLADTTNVIAEGEVMQLMNVRDVALSEASYLHVIHCKTAKLFEASTKLAGLLGQCDAATVEACATYGQALGSAFQIVDDALDYSGDAAVLGKNLGDDLREGKMTLPLIFALNLVSTSNADLLRSAIEKGDVSQLNEITKLVQNCGALDATLVVAAREAQRASSALQALPQNHYTQALAAMAVQLVQRSS